MKEDERSIAWAVALLVCAGAALGCGSKSKSTEGSAKPSASGASAASGPPRSAFLDVLGEDGLGSLGMLDGPQRESALFGAAAPHTSTEPARFSAGWVGVEAADVLRRARAKELEQATVSTGARTCLLFHEGGMVRRLMTNDAIESHEFAMSAAGNVLLWLRAVRDEHQSRQLAFFHRGKDLKLYQAWEGNGARRTEPAPDGLREYVFAEAKDCFGAFRAKNPTPGVGASVAVDPPPPPPPPPPSKVESSYTFKIDAVAFHERDPIHVTFNAPLGAAGENKYWITVVAANAPDSEFGAWHYVATGAESDTLTAPTRGEYEIRLHDAFPMHTFRVMARQRISVTAAHVDPPAESECANAGAPGTVCKLPSGFRGYCNLTSGTCEDQCPGGMGIGPDGQCYPACPSNGNCGDGCSCEWQVCVCPPGD